MKIKNILIISLFIRLLGLLIQRSLGIEWDFHVDSIFYVENIINISYLGFENFREIVSIENSLYIIIGYLFFSFFGFLIEPEVILITANIFYFVITVLTLTKIYQFNLNSRAPLPIYFICLSPYLIHISIHPLKDSFVILLSSLVLLFAIRGSIFKLIFISFCLILSRFYLGILISFLFFFWKYCSFNQLKKSYQFLMAFLFMLLFYFLFYDNLSERVFVDFSGRDFFPDSINNIPNSISLRFFFGWIINLFFLYPFIPANFSEFFYILHYSYFITLIFVGFYKNSMLFFKEVFGLFLISLILFSFILTTTPGAGPLVRYRLFAELLFIIALSACKINIFIPKKDFQH